MVPRNRMALSLALAVASLGASFGLSAEVIPRGRDDYPDPTRRPRKRSREEKRYRAKLAALKAGGVPGAGLWRKCAAGGSVRGR